MGAALIELTGLGATLSGLKWMSHEQLRIGRESNLEIVVRDFSVDRLHAAAVFQGVRWVLRDYAKNPKYPTLLNDVPVGDQKPVLKRNDIVQVGKLLLKVTDLHCPPVGEASTASTASSSAGERVPLSRAEVRIAASARLRWDESIDQAAAKAPASGQMHTAAALLRSNHHLLHLDNLDEMLDSILRDAVQGLAAKRAAIILLDTPPGSDSSHASGGGDLTVRAVRSTDGSPRDVQRFSKTLARRCLGLGESVLLSQETLKDLEISSFAIRPSVLCALLRTQRARLGVLQLERAAYQDAFTESDLYLADALAASVALPIETALLLQQQRERSLETITALARAVELRDQYTADHSRQITRLSLLLADQMQVSTADRQHLRLGANLRDIGKIAIDDAILRKPGKLSDGEFACIKAHTLKGAELLGGMFGQSPLVPIVKHHHERWDGLGYPFGLAREQIPLLARIVAVADAFAAMVTDRPYRRALGLDQAFFELGAMAGSSFDPYCVAEFLSLRPQIQAALAEEQS